ncbi:hypothetical protein RFF05_14585 [Bengtsoniella intestinalis]|uniref:hypothetical protein n=1 Tax=Bengtsoniella intestinalis TaxID=3073143 RepID=UPI00391F6E50
MKRFLLLCLSLALCVSMVACGEKTDGGTQTLDETQGITSATISDEDLVLEVAKRYMTAVEQNDTHTMADCMDPNLQGTAEGTADILGNLLGVGDVADTAISAQGYFAQATLDSLGLTLEYTYSGIEGNPVVNKNDATITLVYDLFATDGTKELSAPLIAEFELLKMDEDWYLKAEPVTTINEDDIVTNGFDIPQVITPENIVGKNISEVEFATLAPFTDGYAAIDVDMYQSEAADKRITRTCFIDEQGTILSCLEYEYNLAPTSSNNKLTDFSNGTYWILHNLSPEENALMDVYGNNLYTGDATLYKTFAGVSVMYTKEETFNGNVYQVGFLGHDGTWIEPLSEDNILAPYMNNNENVSVLQFEDSFLFELAGDIYYSLDTKKTYPTSQVKSLGISSAINDGVLVSEDEDGLYLIGGYGYGNKVGKFIYNGETYDMVSIIDNSSYSFEIYWHDDELMLLDSHEETNFYDLNGQMAIDLSEYDLLSLPYFVGERAILNMSSPDGVAFYTMIDKTGAFLFEPVKGDGGTLITENLIYRDHSLVDDNGTIIYEFKEKEEVEIGSEMISVTDWNEGICYYVTFDGTRIG